MSDDSYPYDATSNLAWSIVRATNTQEQYHNNAEFHATIRVLAETVIPDLIAGVSARCAKKAIDRNERVKELMSSPTPLFPRPHMEEYP